MSLKRLVGAAFFALSTLAVPSIAAAATFQIQAFSIAPTQFSDFTIIYEDTNNDLLFSLDELVVGGFSGITIFGSFLDTITRVPTIADVSTASTPDLGDWFFVSDTSSGGLAPGFFSYTVTEIAPPPSGVVPLPASVLMLLSGLAALGLSRLVGRRALAD